MARSHGSLRLFDERAGVFKEASGPACPDLTPRQPGCRQEALVRLRIPNEGAFELTFPALRWLTNDVKDMVMLARHQKV